MTYSTNYADLLRRQAELQRLGNMPAPTLEQVRVALITEIGELAQELKPDWAWWSKPGAKKEVDRQKVLDEAADILHFYLLQTLVSGAVPDDYEWLFIDACEPIEPLEELLLMLPECGRVVSGTFYLCRILARYGFTPDDLARAYWEKTEINLTRWKEAARG